MIQYTPKELEGNVNVSADHPLGELLKLVLGVVMVCVLGYFAIAAAVEIGAPFIPTAVEESLANSYANHLSVDASLRDQNKNLQAMLERLQKSGKLPLHCKIYLVKSETANAVALPGGNILLFSGLYEKLPNENAIAFVLAHELGHIAHRDHLKGFGRALLSGVAVGLLFGNDDVVSKLSQQSNQVLTAQYSQQQENDADTYALSLLNQSERHVQGALDVFKIFQALEKEEGDNQLAFLASHPLSQDRLGHMKRLIMENKYPL